MIYFLYILAIGILAIFLMFMYDSLKPESKTQVDILLKFFKFGFPYAIVLIILFWLIYSAILMSGFLNGFVIFIFSFSILSIYLGKFTKKL